MENFKNSIMKIILVITFIMLTSIIAQAHTDPRIVGKYYYRIKNNPYQYILKLDNQKCYLVEKEIFDNNKEGSEIDTKYLLKETNCIK